MIKLVKDRCGKKTFGRGSEYFYISSRGKPIEQIFNDREIDLLSIGFDRAFSEVGVDLKFSGKRVLLSSSEIVHDPHSFVNKESLTIKQAIKKIEKLYKEYNYRAFA